MALLIGNGGICNTHITILRKPIPSFARRSSHVTCAKKFSSKTGKFDSKNKRLGGGLYTITTKEEEDVLERERSEREFEENKNRVDNEGGADDGYFLPELPGDKPDFFEGPQWDAFGFFVQYQWAFGIFFALIACGVAVATYNEGATDFKETTVYQEAIQSQELLEEPETSNADVFEANPTEEAPSIE